MHTIRTLSLATLALVGLPLLTATSAAADEHGAPSCPAR